MNGEQQQTLEDFMADAAPTLGYDMSDPQTQQQSQQLAQQLRAKAPGASDAELIAELKSTFPQVAQVVAPKVGVDISSKIQAFQQKYGAAGMEKAQGELAGRKGQIDTSRMFAGALGAAAGVSPETYRTLDRRASDRKGEAERETVGALKEQAAAESGAINTEMTGQKFKQWQEESNAKLKEITDRNNPDSDISKAMRATVTSMVQSRPQFKAIFDEMKIDLNKMTAAQAEKMLPGFDKINDNFQKMMELDHKKALLDQKSAHDSEKLRLQGEAAAEKTKGAAAQAAAELQRARADLAREQADALRRQSDVRDAEGGGITGIKVDKQGNQQLSPDVQKLLAKSAQDAQTAREGLALVSGLRGVVEGGEGSESKLGQAVAGAGSWLPGKMQPDITVANAKIEQFRGSLVGYLNDPRMKGAPSEAEGKKVEAIISNPSAPNSVKLQAIESFERSMRQQIKEHNANYGKYNSQTKARLDALNLGPVQEGESQPAAAGGPVQMKLPDGRTVMIRADKVEEAKKRGATVVE